MVEVNILGDIIPLTMVSVTICQEHQTRILVHQSMYLAYKESCLKRFPRQILIETDVNVQVLPFVVLQVLS